MGRNSQGTKDKCERHYRYGEHPGQQCEMRQYTDFREAAKRGQYSRWSSRDSTRGQWPSTRLRGRNSMPDVLVAEASMMAV